MVWILMDMLGGISFDKALYRYLGCLLEIPFYYLHMYVLWPKLLLQKKYFLYFPSLLTIVLVSALLVLLYRYYIEFPILLSNPLKAEILFRLPSVLRLARSILLWFGPPTVIKVLIDWHVNRLNMERMAKEQKISELNFLKSQINPHFLFNTLNNLYALALNESKKTPSALMQLSQLLSYMIYEGTQDRISLEKEVQHLNSYIELEKLRFGKRLDLKMEIEGDLENMMITPLILLPIAENAFKHCSLNEPGDITIEISIIATKDSLKISTVNPIGNRVEELGNDEPHKGGIGISNISRRLQILYPKKHSLHLDKRAQKFHVDLIIELN